MPVLYARIPEDRVGVLIGEKGRTRAEISARTRARLAIDSEEGEVQISSDDSDPDAALRARDIALAIGRGFSPPRALRLARDGQMLAILDIKFETGKRNKAALRRIRARVIGTRGRARARIEDLSGCFVSVYGSTVSMIGDLDQIDRARRAVELLLRGSEHSTVFHMLARLRFDAAVTDALGIDDSEPTE
ncbi:MAG: KH domain-containing protein [Thermoplasmata archaeon]